MLYYDCDPALGEGMDEETRPHAYNVFRTEAPAQARACEEFDGRQGYVRTLNNRCNPAQLRDMWLEKSGVSWDVVDMKIGHLPFVSKPGVLAAGVLKFANSIMALS